MAARLATDGMAANPMMRFNDNGEKTSGIVRLTLQIG